MNQRGGAHQDPVARSVVPAGSADLSVEKLRHMPCGAGWGLHTPRAAHSEELAHGSPAPQLPYRPLTPRRPPAQARR